MRNTVSAVVAFLSFWLHVQMFWLISLLVQFNPASGCHMPIKPACKLTLVMWTRKQIYCYVVPSIRNTQ